MLALALKCLTGVETAGPEAETDHVGLGLGWTAAGTGVETARLMPVGRYLDLLADLG